MIVDEMQLEGFRNYDSFTAKFDHGINVIAGANARGKTNLLEAVYYLAAGRSFRASGDRELIGFDREKAAIRAQIVSREREQVLEARFTRGRRRELYANGAKLKKAAELSGRLMAVLFNPDDLDMIKDGAAVRRRLLDHSLSQLRPRYVTALTEFNRLHENKTRILRGHWEKPSLLELLDDFDHRMCEQSARLIYYRAAFVEKLAPRVAEYHAEFSGGAEELEIRYKTVGGIEPHGKKPSELLPELLEHQRAFRTAELKSGLCLSGAHKDELEIDINGSPARKFASQGQARTAAVSIKLAERDIFSEDFGSPPVLLLDDVLSELDAVRQDFILSRIKSGQVLITCCDNRQLEKSAEGCRCIFI